MPRLMTPTAPATPTVPPPPARVIATSVSCWSERATTSLAALTCALLSIRAVAWIESTATLTPAPTPAPPPMAIEAETRSRWNWLPAATRTDWPELTPVLSVLTSAPLPTVALVSTVMMFTVPPTPTPALPPTAAATPTDATSSLLVADTATPRNPLVWPALTVCGDESLTSEAGMLPCLTRLWERPVSPAAVIAIAWPFLASSLVAASWKAPEVSPIT